MRDPPAARTRRITAAVSAGGTSIWVTRIVSGPRERVRHLIGANGDIGA